MLLSSGCLISAPEGAHQFWPPTLGTTVEAVVAGDLDANGSSEVVVFGSGDDEQRGMYYLRGGTDLDFGSGQLVRSFSRFVPTELFNPLAAVYVPGVAPRIFVAHSGGDTIELSQLSNTLEILETGASTIAPGGTTLWVRIVNFPGMMPHPTVSNGALIDHMTPDLSDPKPIPAPGGPAWPQAVLATSYAMGMNQFAVVATPELVMRASLPTMAGAQFMWEAVRMNPPAQWSGQTTFDFNGDGREEIAGVDLLANRLCVVDPGATLPVSPSCIQLQGTFPGVDIELIVGTNLTQNPGLDVLIAHAGSNSTNYTLVEDVTFNGTQLAAAMVRQLPVAGPPRGRTVVVNDGPSTPFAALTFGTDGNVVCVIGPC
jgi:hypothetical protein